MTPPDDYVRAVEAVLFASEAPLTLDAIAELERVSFPVPWKREFFASEVGAAHRYNRVVRAPDGSLAGYVFCAFAGGEILTLDALLEKTGLVYADLAPALMMLELKKLVAKRLDGTYEARS